MSLGGTLGNLFLIAGFLGLGYKWRPSFLFTVVGELFWIVRGVTHQDYDLVTICTIFTVMALYNYCLWGRDTVVLAQSNTISAEPVE